MCLDGDFGKSIQSHFPNKVFVPTLKTPLLRLVVLLVLMAGMTLAALGTFSSHGLAVVKAMQAGAEGHALLHSHSHDFEDEDGEPIGHNPIDHSHESASPLRALDRQIDKPRMPMFADYRKPAADRALQPLDRPPMTPANV